MNAVLLLLSGFVVGIITTCFVLASWPVNDPEPKASTREQVMARVLLHQTRRNRQLNELERDVSERAADRLQRLEEEQDWPGGTS